MNTDKELLASEKQALTATAVSTDSIMVSGLSGLDRGSRLRAFAQLETALTGGTGTGVTVEIIQADNAALTQNVESLFSTGVKANGTNTAAGSRLVDVPIPAFTKPYAGFRYTMATGAYAAGAITAGFVVGTETPQATRPLAESHGF
ncbi:MAG TPA: hypothetical protein VF655_00150 [Allosphingosinicella sp.]|jgi:hypothetical protein